MSARLALLAVLAIAPVGWTGAPVSLQFASASAAEEPGQSPVAPLVEPRHPGAAALYFFSPDWRPADLGELAVAIEETFAAGAVSVSVQGFTRYDDFERQALVQPPVFVIGPDWLGAAEGSDVGLDLEVVARPQRHGKSTYRKALMARPGVDSIDDLARGSIAATLHSMSEGSAEVVLEAFHLDAESARVVPVPKDVDALLALSFGQVDAALVTSAQYELLARTRPQEAEKLTVLAFSPEVGLPPVFASKGADPASVAALRSLLGRLPGATGGAALLELLGFDGFVLETRASAAAPSAATSGVAKSRAPAEKKTRDARGAPR
ncbi:MAG: phosphate/phosphite/phosphonate ABC transporter substrate-binding protein [Candidatus Binatia bacterium]